MHAISLQSLSSPTQKNMKRLITFALFLPSILFAQAPSFTPHGSGGGGYMYDPAINPHNNQQIYINCDMAGVYRTENGGETWQIQHYNQLVSQVKGQVQFTSNPTIQYTLSRSLTNTADPLFRGEPKKSIDGGLTWQAMTDPSSTGIHRLLADPNSTQRLLMSEYDRLFFSNDGGESYTEVYNPGDGMMWLGGAFWDGQDIYVGTGKGLLVSHDSGQTFAIENIPGLPDGAGIYHLNGASQNGLLRLFAVTAQAADLFAWMNVIDLESSFIGISRLDYATSSAWIDAQGNIGNNFRIQWVDLSNQNTQIVWVAAGNEMDTPHLFKSTDGGQSWENTFFPSGNENVSTGWGGDGGPFNYYYAGAPLGLDVSDNNPEIVVFTDGYSHITTNGGLTWKALYVNTATMNPVGGAAPVSKYYQSSGLDVTTGHHMLFLSADEIFGGCTDIGNQYSIDGGNTWSFERNVFFPWGNVSNPNWYIILQHPQNQNELYAGVSELNDMYMPYRIRDTDIEGAKGMVLHTIDKGIHWDTLHLFGHPVVWLAIDPQNTQRLFASVVHQNDGGIYRSEDGGQNWLKLTFPTRTEGHPYNIRILNDGTMTVSFSARALEDGVTLTPSSGVFYSTDGGNTWEDRTIPQMMYFTKDLIIDPNDISQNTWYATVWGRFTTFPGPNNQGNGGLYRTNDRGLTWERVFVHERTESATIFPSNPNVMYVSVELEGLFFTKSLTSAAPNFEKLDNFPFPRPKRVFFNPYTTGEIWVTTMGGGLWRGNDILSATNETIQNQYLINITPNPACNQMHVSSNLFGAQNETTIVVYDIMGRVVIKSTFDKSTAPQKHILDTTLLPNGTYYIQCSNGHQTIATTCIKRCD